MQKIKNAHLRKHTWHWLERGYGQPPKQNLADPVVFEGYVAQCECGKKMFFPDDPKLRPTEIE